MKFYLLIDKTHLIIIATFKIIKSMIIPYLTWDKVKNFFRQTVGSLQPLPYLIKKTFSMDNFKFYEVHLEQMS